MERSRIVEDVDKGSRREMEFAMNLDHWVILSKAYMKKEVKAFRSSRHRAVLCPSAAAPLQRAPWLLHAIGSLPIYGFTYHSVPL